MQRKQEISDAINGGLQDVEPSVKLKSVFVVIDVVKLLITNARESEETLKLPSSQENENSNHYSKNSDGGMFFLISYFFLFFGTFNYSGGC